MLELFITQLHIVLINEVNSHKVAAFVERESIRSGDNITQFQVLQETVIEVAQEILTDHEIALGSVGSKLKFKWAQLRIKLHQLLIFQDNVVAQVKSIVEPLRTTLAEEVLKLQVAVWVFQTLSINLREKP